MPETKEKLVAPNAVERLVYKKDFTRETDADDGIQLQILDEDTFKVVGYCVACGGHWFDYN